MRKFAVLAIAITFVACGSGEIETADDVQLFTSSVKNSGLTKACEELDNVCKTYNQGCDAYQMFCTSQGTPPPKPDPDFICQQIAAACGSGFQQACDLEKQFCASSNGNGGNGVFPLDQQLACQAVKAACSAGYQPACTFEQQVCDGSIVLDKPLVCTQLAGACQSGVAQACDVEKQLCGGQTPTPPPPPVPPAPADCCAAAEACLNSGSGCDDAIKVCSQIPGAEVIGQQLLGKVYDMACKSGFMSTGSPCCQQLDSCVQTLVGCDLAAKTCLSSVQLPGGLIPSLPPINSLLAQVCGS